MFIKQESLNLTLEQFEEIVNNPNNTVVTWLDIYVGPGNYIQIFNSYKDGDTISVTHEEWEDEDIYIIY